jgi:hypothetical protein
MLLTKMASKKRAIIPHEKLVNGTCNNFVACLLFRCQRGGYLLSLTKNKGGITPFVFAQKMLEKDHIGRCDVINLKYKSINYRPGLFPLFSISVNNSNRAGSASSTSIPLSKDIPASDCVFSRDISAFNISK